MKVARAEFHRLAEKALSETPKPFLKLLYNLSIEVKAAPGAEAGKWKGSKTLLGLYSGLSRQQMAGPDPGSHLPARIVLYQNNISALCDGPEALYERVRTTLRHELAHHFGFTDEELKEKWPEGA